MPRYPEYAEGLMFGIKDRGGLFFIIFLYFVLSIKPLILINDMFIKIIMQSQIVELKKIDYYLIINKATKQCLHLPSNSQNFEKEKLLLAKPNQEDLSQIWMTVQVSHEKYPGRYEIVHTISTLVLSHEKQQMKLKFGQWKQNQLFFLARSDPKHYPNLFYIRTERDSKQYIVVTEDGVFCKEIKYPDQNCLWQLVPVHNNSVINRSCYIECAMSNQVLDVPRASDKPGISICQYPCNNRFNQRWNLIRVGDFYHIQNLKTKMFLDIKGQSKKPGAHIIQWGSTGALNQLWIVEYQGKNIYQIRSAMDEKLYMSVKDNSLKECVDIVTTHDDNQCFWRIIGHIP